MVSAAAALTALSPTTATKIAKAIKGLQDARTVRRQRLDSITTLKVDVRAQVDEVLLVLALLGEVLLPLGAFDNNYYPQTLDEVEACLVRGGHDLIPTAFAELDAELQYAVTAGMSFCSAFAPMPVYRGFGAAVLGDWSWGCPDTEKLLKKMKAKDSTLSGFLGRNKDPQPNRPVLLAFDQVVQMLQVKQVAFLSVKPVISGFAEQQPRYDERSVRKFRRELNLQIDWTKKVENLGHPAPTGIRTTTWAIPFATWTSPFSCEHQKSRDAWETIMANQMDPGRLLHAFVCRGNLNMSEGQLLILAPGTPAESLACWLEGLSSMTHSIVRWTDLDRTGFETKCSKALRKQLGQYPLPDKFVIRDTTVVHRPSIATLPLSPSIEQSVSPPPYSRQGSTRLVPSDTSGRPPALPAVELATERDPVELAEITTPISTRLVHHAASTPALIASRHPSVATTGGTITLRSLTRLRRKQVPTTRHGSPFVPSPSAALPLPPAQLSHQSAVPTIPMPEPPAAPPLSILAPKPPSTPTTILPYHTSPEHEAHQTLASTEPPPAPDDDGGPVELPAGLDALDLADSPNPVRVEKPPADAQSTTLTKTVDNGSKYDNDITEVTNAVEMPAETSDETYLQLLERVAHGELSPQALLHMLQAGNTAQELEATPLAI
ncbi:hypothetical protein LTR65_009185 [Meristemomyces frigidus]